MATEKVVKEKSVYSQNSIDSLITEILSKKLNDGTLEKMISDKIDETILKCIDSATGYSSESYGVLKNKIDSLICNSIESSNFDNYTVKITEILNKVLLESDLSTYKTISSNLNEILRKDENVTVCGQLDFMYILEKYSEYLKEHYKYEKDAFDAMDIMSDEGEYTTISPSIDIQNISGTYSTTKKFRIELSNDGPQADECTVNFYLIKYPGNSYFNLKSDVNSELHNFKNLTSMDIFLLKLDHNYCKINASENNLDNESYYFDDDVTVEFEDI